MISAKSVVFSLCWLVLAGIEQSFANDEVQSAATTVGQQRAAAQELIERVEPKAASQFVVETIPAENGYDVFEIESRGDKIVLRGNSGVAIASAFYRYLKQFCHCQMTWCGDNLTLPDSLPSVPQKLRVVTPFAHRVYFNYCTFSYSMPWWNWDRWQREIDWMAMHGVNMPLAITGQEAVWENTLRHFKMSDDEIRKFLCGPAFFAWQYMANLEGWGGPLPQNWIDSHVKLGQQILQRERSLGMTPILQGFTGFVPRELKTKYPAAKIAFKPNWCSVFPGAAQLDPLDPLFKEMGKTFIEEQTKLFGTDHWYAADPFHESSPPSNAPDYLSAVAKTILATLESADPDAKIAMQTWSVRKAIATNIPKDRLLLLDLAGQKWKSTDGFWGIPWVCGVLHNFGGRLFLGGNVPEVLRNALTVKSNPKAGDVEGIGMFPEAIIQNPVIYEAATNITWMQQQPETQAWFSQYTLERYGKSDANAERAWDVLEHSVYGTNAEAGSAESVICARPALFPDRAAPNAGFTRHYDPRKVWEAWTDLLAANHDLGNVDTYRYDLVDVARQGLADLSIPLQRDITAAYFKKDSAALKQAAARFLDLAKDMDTLLGTRKEFLLGKWLDDAKSWATNDAERRQYERNARLLVTVWGPSAPGALLFDYSDRQWSGLIRGYYIPRWEKFIAYLESQPLTANRFDGKELRRSYNRPADDANPFYSQLAKWEQDWCDGTESYSTQPHGDSVAVASSLLAKWKPVADAAFAHYDLRKSGGGAGGDATIYKERK